MFKPLAIALAISAAFPAIAAETTPNKVERVTVTGSNIRVSQKAGATAVQVISAKEIAASGKTSVSEVIRSISANSGNSYNEQFTGSFSAGTSGVSLRGLGQKNTLVLINGKRISSYATAQNLQETFVDLNSLPMAAVQRIEILKDGASSVYGSDAVAGVVNIILYSEFKGTELSAELGSSTEGTGQTEKNFSIKTGFGDFNEDNFNVVFSLDGQKRDQLDQSDVSWMKEGDFRNQSGGSLNRVITNYYDGDPTKLLGGPQGPIKLTDYGSITDGKTGQVLAYNNAPYSTLIPGIERYHAFARANLRINDDTQAYAEYLYGFSRANLTFAAPLTVSSTLRAWNNQKQALDTINNKLPVGHPNNPGTTPLDFTATLFDLGKRLKTDEVTLHRVLSGIKGTALGWDWDASLGYSQSTLEETVQNFVNRYEYEKVLKDGSYNFADQSKNSEEVRNRLRLSTLRPAKSSLITADISASSAELFELPAGSVGFATGAQFRQEKMDSRTSDAVLSGTELRPAINIIDGERKVSAVFAELNIPVIKDLNVNLAARADHYSDFGNAFSPKASARYQAADWLLLRGSASRGFRAPSLPEITQSSAVSYGAVVDPRDPIAPTKSRGVTNIIAANKDLQPERSNNFNLGFVLSPTNDSSIGLDYYNIKQSGLIGTQSGADIIANESRDPSKIVRDDKGRISTLYRQYSNMGDRETSGIDLDLRQRFNSKDYGSLKLGSQISHVLRFAEPLSTGEPLTDGAGSNQFGSIPKWRAVSDATWDIGAWSTTLTWSYVGGYDQASASATDTTKYVDSFNTFDLTASWKLAKDTTLTAKVINLSNTRPPWDSSTDFFDHTQADPRGRFASAKLTYKF
ncbi:TonB-dependent receptor [Iodobacter fluviatilis]|uniref:Colicin I receptor n=1 Tax=Iodobacter fluviatilis TaxID=537 RepID=A0A377Q7W1_9NEIS|nr:TonB-dependent receptor [Iodobacter fluviatilis]TCU89470.1 iron complex outermembrane receptor protein [Iodobacter fluviatilis]STQ90840.1 Colicin I receptor precursor [Iodobacter fluviatilis]